MSSALRMQLFMTRILDEHDDEDLIKALNCFSVNTDPILVEVKRASHLYRLISVVHHPWLNPKMRTLIEAVSRAHGLSRDGL